MSDRIETLGQSVIQHGKGNDRVYLMKLDPADAVEMPARLERLAIEHGYTKLFCKVPADLTSAFLEAGFLVEAQVPDFFGPGRAALFLGRYLDERRRHDTQAACCQQVLEAATEAASQPDTTVDLPGDCRVCLPVDAEAMAGLYQAVFESYPFPIHDPAWILETMQTHIVYFGVWLDGKLAALSSAETDRATRSVEMTDFATLPEYRGRRLAQGLLARMDQYAASEGFCTGFTIARSQSFGMNITFARRGYQYGGTLVNNTQICGHLESMNVWYTFFKNLGNSCSASRI